MEDQCEKNQMHVGFQINTLSHLIRRFMDQTAFGMDHNPVTGMQGWIIGYLYDNRGKDIFQRDIQTHFSVRRSTVTGILQLMEKNGLITRQSVGYDARLKRLELTPKAIEHHERFHRGIRESEERLSAVLTPEERETFIRLCEKLRAHIERLENEKGRVSV